MWKATQESSPGRGEGATSFRRGERERGEKPHPRRLSDTKKKGTPNWRKKKVLFIFGDPHK